MGLAMEKSERFGLVLSPTEKTAVLRLAEAEGGLSMAALVRRLIREAAREHGLWPPQSRHGGTLKDTKALNGHVS
jgi:hypothetical protein